MQMAAEQDPKFKFEASEWPNGHYVHTLAGHKEEPMGYHYWLLYRLTEIPDPASPPGNQLVAPVGKGLSFCFADFLVPSAEQPELKWQWDHC